jgi:predicted nuclease of predicted toxin-antitoxin system
MKFLLDQDVYAVTARFLATLEHDVLLAAQIGMARSRDAELLKFAREANRLFVTRDRDFGSLVFVEGLQIGVLYLRMLPATQHDVHRELERVLQTYTEEELRGAFVVVERDKHRFRRLPR